MEFNNLQADASGPSTLQTGFPGFRFASRYPLAARHAEAVAAPRFSVICYSRSCFGLHSRWRER
jgi:hypothetical protein